MDVYFDYKKYGTPHRMFVQGLMTRGIIDPDEFDHLFNLCLLRAKVKPPNQHTEHRQKAKKAFISTIKSTIESKTSLKLLLVYNEESKQMKRSLLLSNQMDRSRDSNQLTIKAMVTFLPHEIEFLQLLVHEILEDEMREVPQTPALNLSKKVKKKKMTLDECNELLHRFIEHKWLVLSKESNIRLSTRFIYEMEPFLKDEYGHIQDLKCTSCHKIVIRSIACPNEDCDSQFHVYCAATSKSRCIVCEEDLPSKRSLFNPINNKRSRKRRKSRAE